MRECTQRPAEMSAAALIVVPAVLAAILADDECLEVRLGVCWQHRLPQ